MLAQPQMPVSANATGLWPQSCTRTNELESKQFSCPARSPLGETIFGYAYLKICHMAENKRQRDRGKEREGGETERSAKQSGCLGMLYISPLMTNCIYFTLLYFHIFYIFCFAVWKSTCRNFKLTQDKQFTTTNVLSHYFCQSHFVILW